MYKYRLTILVLSQFFCTSLWFAGNSAIENTQHANDSVLLGHLSSAVQAGFIIGTFFYALFAIADRYSPSHVFFWSSLLASLSNLLLIYPALPLEGLLTFRFLTGFFLAGIYPVGMKIAVDHYESDLGKPMGFIVGALVMGTATPHLLKSINLEAVTANIVVCTSVLAVLGGLTTLLFVDNGPFRKKAEILKFDSFFQSFRSREFRTIMFGYIGHTWEIYAFWSCVPQILLIYADQHKQHSLNLPILSFLIIACGSIGCIVSGYTSRKLDSKKFATFLLLSSAICCLLSPFILNVESIVLLVTFLMLWNIFAVSDSPLFSRLMAENAPRHARGAALTIANCLGFSVTIISIQLTSNLLKITGSHYVFLLIAIGPLFGIISLLMKNFGKNTNLPSKNLS